VQRPMRLFKRQLVTLCPPYFACAILYIFVELGNDFLRFPPSRCPIFDSPLDVTLTRQLWLSVEPSRAVGGSALCHHRLA
jgi:hypothetical protein